MSDRERPSRERVESILESLPEPAWSIPEPPELDGPLPPAPGPERAKRPRRPRILARPVPLLVALAGCLVLAAAGLAAGLALSAGDEADDDPPPPPLASIVSTSELRGLGGGGGKGVVEVVEGAGGSRSLDVTFSGVEASGPGDYYELWLMKPGKFVSLGSFAVSDLGEQRVEVPLPVDPASYRAYDLSLERDDGNPSHGEDSLLRGPTTAS